MFTPQMRRKKIVSFAWWGAVNLVLTIYLIFLISRYWRNWDHECIGLLSLWLAGYLCIHLAHLVRKIILIFFWWKGSDPTILEV